jgi:hypothetical protein
MPAVAPSELKKILLAEGFEIYRTLQDRVILADRVRDNLIMDSNVAATVAESGFGVRVVFRAQSTDFPAEPEAALVERARGLGAACAAREYQEVGVAAVPIHDPGDKTRTLDVWYEVSFAKSVVDVAELFEELRYAMKLEKAASSKPAR